MEYVIVNGEIIKKEEANLTPFFCNNPLIISEKMWFGFGGVPLFSEKMEQLASHMQNLGVDIPSLFLKQRELFRRIKRMLNKNRFYRTGLIHFQLLNSDSKTDFILFATPFEEMEFKYHERGVLIGLAENHKYSGTPIPIADNYKYFFYRLAEEKNKNSIIQNFIFLNEKGMVCDAGQANVFLIKKQTLITPSPDSGCISDSLRRLVLEAAGNFKLQLIESDEISPEMIYKMDEIFIAAESTGIYWVLGIDTKRFVHSVSGQIHEELNKILKSKVN